MAQTYQENWTNPATAVARNVETGFEVVKAEAINVTDGGHFIWVKGMANGSFLNTADGSITTTDGFTPLNQGALFGSAISALTNANPGVITVADAAAAGFAAGDVIKVTGIAESGSGASLNAEYTIASISGNAITTATDTSAGAVYVSGGFASRVRDSAGNAIPINNTGIRGMTLGTGVVGTDNDASTAIFYSEESVT